MEEATHERARKGAMKLIELIHADPGLPKFILAGPFVYAILDSIGNSPYWED
jgi:hypothetical protein